MATAFDTFPQYAFGQYAGQIEDRSMADVVSRLADSSDIGFGLAVRDIDRRSARFPTSSEVSHGITVRSVVKDNPAGDNPTPVYEQDTAMSVIRVGRVWVSTVDGSSVNGSVYVVPDTGALTNTDDGGTNIQLAGARFLTDASAGDLALVQLNGVA